MTGVSCLHPPGWKCSIRNYLLERILFIQYERQAIEATIFARRRHLVGLRSSSYRQMLSRHKIVC
jgi:hypothetical protein